MENKLQLVFNNLLNKYMKAKEFNDSMGNVGMSDYIQAKIDAIEELDNIIGETDEN